MPILELQILFFDLATNEHESIEVFFFSDAPDCIDIQSIRTMSEDNGLWQGRRIR